MKRVCKKLPPKEIRERTEKADKKSLSVSKTEKIDYRKMNPAEFAVQILHITPFPYQTKLLLDESKRLVACMGRQSGKTSVIAMRAIHFAYTKDKVTVLITSPSMRQSMIMFDRISSFMHSTKMLRQEIVRATRTIIQLKNGSQIIALPCSENLLRGYTAHMIICDETAFMPEETITNVVFPMLSTTNGYAIFLSTPWGRDHFFYRAFKNPKYSVHRVKSNECPPISAEFLEEQRQNMTAEAYKMEFEAEFAEGSSCFFSQDLIRGCIDPTLDLIPSLETEIPSGEYFGGCDFGKLEDYSVIVVLNREGDLLKLVYLHEFLLNTPYMNVIGHLARANQKFGFQKLLVDQTGVGEVVLEELKEQGVQNVEGVTFTAKAKEATLTALKIAMEQHVLKMPYHRRLCQQLNEQQYAYNKAGYLTFSHPEESHDDIACALALANQAARQKKLKPFFSVVQK